LFGIKGLNRFGRVVSMGVKGLKSAVDHPPLSIVEVRNKWDIFW
jgi:hypothetical protein